MPVRGLRAMLLSLALVTLFVPSFAVATASAQGNPYVWDKAVPIERKPPKPATPRPHHPPPPPKKQTAPLLTLKWRLLKRTSTGQPDEVNAYSTFYQNDRLRLELTANQNCYLYIINQAVDATGQVVAPPHLIFPDSAVNDGKNYIVKNAQYTVPTNCATLQDPSDCWMIIGPPAGKDIFIVILSRDMITDLPQKILSGGPVSVDGKNIALLIGSGQRLVETSRPNLSTSQGGGAGRYIHWVFNANTRDNEQLIAAVTLEHQDRPLGRKESGQ
jgi:hypothetical protein